VGVHITRHARRLARRLASHDAGRSPLGAPPWRFWALRVPRFPLRVTRLCRSFGGSGSVTASSSRPGLIPRLAVRDLPAARCPIMHIFDLTRILRRGCRHQAGHRESVFVSVGISAWRAGSLPPGATVASRYRRTPHLAPHSGCLENTPSLSKAANVLMRTHIVVKRKMRFVANCPRVTQPGVLQPPVPAKPQRRLARCSTPRSNGAAYSCGQRGCCLRRCWWCA
jgi:hypothetical protein